MCSSNKYAVITGAAGGIGKATAFSLASNGIQGMVLSDINSSEIKETCLEITLKTGCRCIPATTDISSSKSIELLFEIAIKEFETIHVFVNCAGICPVATIEDIGEAEWDNVLAINLKGAYLCSREALRIMKPQKYGKIINVSSIAGRIGGIATGINYSTSKGALISMTMTMAKAAGPYNINVNNVAPGFINTNMTKNFTHFNTDTIPLRRIGTPEDVANVIQFLASDKSSYITGSTIDINGGVYMN
jgi:3-oxoacyl-[acyl-carrier protein] reductase